MKTKSWLVYALITTAFWGVWGALIEIPEKAGFPATLGYCVWALTMIVPALYALKNIGWDLDYDRKAILHGTIIGILGASGQLVLFQALITGPAYLVFPFISLSPLVTILMSYFLIRERATQKAWTGIVLAIIAIPLLSYQPKEGGSSGYFWILLSLFVFLAWGIQAFFMKMANRHMKAESIFFYMMTTGIILIPIALWMTDFKQDINWGLKWISLTAGIQILNAIGALCLVYAFRYGKAIIVSPMTNAGAPVITIILSLLIYALIPHWIIMTGMLLAVIAIFLMAD
jgi:uncharacterized membrane protein